MSATASWGRKRPLAQGEQRFVTKVRKQGRHVTWMPFDVLTDSYPGAIPGFGSVPGFETEAACEAMCARLEQFFAGRGAVR